MTDPNYAQNLNAQYTRPTDLAATILESLRASGKDLDTLNYKDLAAIDQFHTRGHASTLELAHLANIQSSHTILDIGGGLGGPARLLAAEFGPQITVLDLTEQYITVGQLLTDLTRLSALITFQHGNALAIPYPDASFDLAWTQHSSMNIPDKPQLYAEIHRILKPGGTLAIHEIAAGSTQPLHFPVPWAATPDISFLLPAHDLRTLILASGFHELHWNDLTTPTIQWLHERQQAASQAASASPTPAPGLNLLLGTRTPQIFTNLAQNLSENRARVIMATFQKT